MLALLLLTAALLTGASAANCTQKVISLNITSDNARLNFPAQPTQNDLLYYSQLAIAINGNNNVSSKYIIDSQSLTQQVSIWTELCVPSNGSSTLQILTHGIGFDHTFWNGLNGTYTSYQDIALAAGYATLSYDRLGIGQSSKPNGANNTQGAAHVAVVAALTKQLRSGSSAYGYKASKIVHVGHSFGSEITNSLIVQDPSASDGVVLTGFSFNSTGLPAEVAGTQAGVAAQVDPSRFSGLDQTYLLFNSSAGYQLIFFFTPNFVPSVQQATYTNRQTVTIGELITMNTLNKPATSFTGPVLIIDGEYDQIFCAGDCWQGFPTGKTIPQQAAPMYSSSSNFQTYLVQGTGHAWPFQYSVNETSNQIQSFIKSNVY